MPLISVIMAVYNGERYLREAVDSVLGQTWTDLELIVIDDGSTDGTAAMLAGYADSRIRVSRNPANLGLTQSLNRGLSLAGGEFVARLDADDISLPPRLERQVAFLREHPEVVMVGSDVGWISADGADLGIHSRQPYSDAAIRWVMLLQNAFWHSSVMLRRRALTEGGLAYDETLRYAQDYDLWSRVLRYGQGANLADELVQMRNHAGQITQTRYEEQQATADGTAAANLAAAGLPFDLGEIRRMRRLPEGQGTGERVERARCLLKLFRQAFPRGRADAELLKLKREFLWTVRLELRQLPLGPASLAAWGAYIVARLW
jgi:hypothetical protein